MFRKAVSLTSFLSFILVVLTSVVLYIEPHGRTAYWADWTLLGLTKTQWDNIHLTTGVLFLLAGLLHIWLNWKPMMNYMKNRARAFTLTPALVASLVVTLFVTIGTLTETPPMKQVVDFSSAIKDGQAVTYGDPPYAHAETSTLKKFSSYLQLDLNGAIEALKQAGYQGEITESSTILDIARANDVSPDKVYKTIRDALTAGDPFAAMPPTAPAGSGKLTLEAFCATHGLDLNQAVARLAAKGLAAEPGQTLKEIGAPSGMTPPEVYKAIRNE